MARAVVLSPVDHPLGAPQLTRVGQASDAATSVAMPTHAVGDLILVFTTRDGSTTVPSKPSASGTVPAWVDIQSGAGANTCSARLAYFVATATNHTTGTWSNATGIAVLVYRGQDAATPIGASAEGGASSNSISYPALTLQVTDGSSWVAGFSGHRSATNQGTNAPSGMGVRTSVAAELAGCDTGGGVSSWSAQTASVNASSGWRAITVEIRSARGGTVAQTITDESGAPTAIAFTAVKGSLSLGTVYLFEQNADGLWNASGFPVTLTAGGGGFQVAWARGSNVILQGV